MCSSDLSMPAISPTALAQKSLATLDQLYSQILSMSSDKQRTLDILSALIAMQAPTTHVGLLTIRVKLLRIAERLLALHPGDGSQALRMIHSLVHTGRSLMSMLWMTISLFQKTPIGMRW